MRLQDKLFSFKGRLRRLDWWLWGIAVAAPYPVVSYVIASALFPGDPGARSPLVGGPAGPLLASILITALFQWPQLALSTKRAHDLNWPAWPFIGLHVTALTASYLPVGPFAAMGGYATEAPTGALTVAYVAFIVVWVGAAVTLGFMGGTPGPNRFGPSPQITERVFTEPGGLG